MHKVARPLFALVTLLSIAMPARAVDDDSTRELRREIIKLHGDMRLSLANQQLLAENGEMVPLLSDSNDATILAALEIIRGTQIIQNDVRFEVPAVSIAAARNKIEIYKMLCISAGPHPDIFDQYCQAPPYQGLLQGYRHHLAKLSTPAQ